jgi:hypothetical protein
MAMDIQIVFHSTMAPSGVDKALAELGGLGARVKDSKKQGSKIYFGFFWTGFRSSETKRYSRSESRDMGVTALKIIGGASIGYLSKW